MGLLLLFTTCNFLKSTIFALCADESISVIITICESSTLNGQQEALVEVIKFFCYEILEGLAANHVLQL